ncbi:BolA family protein [Teredinibacter sp. KSP-S5-2]|uniref:BolA family protein n=1 Tax=Teredinibacter sp. KSP-S5-2 TaxID=3034506 RepID=UPI002934E863|nr:BolA/IbaG family iron-sulfur metabolism protein [Teredinibacter sp. KSP-S5-2]WNO09594.1 BolA/IbaG family iron-sulfur metabolism protein [Teredinibacter sp. KSP-S5-2]
MQSEQIKAAIEAGIAESTAEVGLEGDHAHISVVSPAFAGLMPVKRQQLVYGILNEAIASGAIHAVHLKTYTPEEWQNTAP